MQSAHETEAKTGTLASVLVVEDDTATREALAELLGNAGYKVVTAGDGEEALSVLRQGSLPSIILLDLVMPRKDGLHFREEQLTDPALREIPVIVLSGQHEARITAAQLGVAGCVLKPVHFDKLLSLLASTLRYERHLH